MAPILTIFGPNESQRCQLNFEKNLGRRKNFREGEKFEKVSRKVRKILARTRFLGRNKIETFICFQEKQLTVCWEVLRLEKENRLAAAREAADEARLAVTPEHDGGAFPLKGT